MARRYVQQPDGGAVSENTPWIPVASPAGAPGGVMLPVAPLRGSAEPPGGGDDRRLHRRAENRDSQTVRRVGRAARFRGWITVIGTEARATGISELRSSGSGRTRCAISMLSVVMNSSI